mmetsp:Transcript_20116/g.37336  ORF Transcript_20116/g.37336 Transcript_20116/m.37336 type:complete len:191 (-) Transcript_20116:289-861(-)
MSLSYKGSSFGLDKPTASASATFSRKPAHLATNPLNPWFLSNGIPDFSPQIDKEYKILTTKRKLSQLIKDGANGDCVQESTIIVDQVCKKVKSNSTDGGVAERASSCSGNDDQESGAHKGSGQSSSAESQPKGENDVPVVLSKTAKALNESDSIAQSLLKSLQNEKAKSKLLEDKIMNSFAATTAKESKK